MARKGYSGGAAKTTITAGLAASGETTITIASASGWPDGLAGERPFVVVVDPGLATEEKILCSQRSNLTVTISQRGYDGTAAQTHSTGAGCWHVLDADTIDEANAHVNDDTRDDHSQYLDTTRHDVATRHTFGNPASTAYGTPDTPAAVGTTAAAGTGGNPAREDHVHALGSGVAGDGLALAAGVLSVGVDGSTIEINADALRVKDLGIATGKIAANAVTTAKIADAQVTQAKLAAGYRLTYAGASAPGSPDEGDVWYETDTDKLWAYNGTSWVAALDPNAWTDFTPQWLGMTEGNGANAGAYQVQGKTLRFRASITLGSTSSVSSTLGIILPASKTLAGAATEWQCVTLAAFDANGARYVGAGYGAGGDPDLSRFAGSGTTWDSNSPFIWTTDDIIMATGTVEIA